MAKIDDDDTQHPSAPKEHEVVGYRPRVVVKFNDWVELPYEDGVEVIFDEEMSSAWQDLVEKYPGITIKKLFTAVEPERIRKLIEEAREHNPSYQRPDNYLLTYFFIESPPGVAPEALAKALSSLDFVETAYFDPPGLEPQVNSANNPLATSQGYLNSAPVGINARYAWNLPGGDGKGQRLIDLERGWFLDHEDLPTRQIPIAQSLIDGIIEPGHASIHGTNVLGIICGEDNTIGIVGIAPHSSVQVVSYYGNNIPNAILAAVNTLPAGGVLLLEVQLLYVPGSPLYWPLMPVEVLKAAFDMIELATTRGIVVVEAAGNGGHDLDTYIDEDSGDAILDRNGGGFRDSGAIFVGAATSANRYRLAVSNYGNRVDCYAWGERVATTATNHPLGLYTDSFGGTSAAAAIIAGAALALQGIVAERGDPPLEPAVLRAILSDPAMGTPFNVVPGFSAQHIGIMPDLRMIIQEHFPPPVVNPNTASVAELQGLPGIGPTLVQRIIDYREAHPPPPDPFRRLQDLGRVHGIGGRTLEKLEPYVIFE